MSFHIGQAEINIIFTVYEPTHTSVHDGKKHCGTGGNINTHKQLAGIAPVRYLLEAAYANWCVPPEIYF